MLAKAGHKDLKWSCCLPKQCSGVKLSKSFLANQKYTKIIIIGNVEMADFFFFGKTEEFDFFSGWIFKATEVRGTDPSYWELKPGREPCEHPCERSCPLVYMNHLVFIAG